MTLFSVVIPTYRRRRLLLSNLAAFERQTERDFEVVVVDDGSDDGTAESVDELDTSFPLRLVRQRNQGAAAARNAGVEVASGEVILTLDDDMEPEPGMLAAHRRRHEAGADVVLGDIPLHPDSPDGMLARGVARWARERRERLSAPGAEVRLDDLLTGQISIARGAYEAVGGFDAEFTRDGLFGGEDIDFGHRLRAAGFSIVFAPEAISLQYYDIDPATYLRRTREAGRSDRELVEKHPELAALQGAAPRFKTRRSRWLLAPFVVAPAFLSAPIRAAAVMLARSGASGERATRAFFAVRTMEYLRGARGGEGGGAAGSAVVLAYHAVSDLGDDPVLAEYGVPLPQLAGQLDELAGRGHRFVDLGRLLDALAGGEPLPPGATLVTFDDAYADLVEAARTVLAPRRIPAVVFAVSGQLGGSNEWDQPLGARPLPLLDADGLRELEGLGLEIGSHGVSHRPLASLPAAERRSELVDSAAALEAAGIPRPRAFAYPHGAWDAGCAAAAAAAGYDAAFTIDPGLVGGASRLHSLPRVEVLAGDSSRALRLKLASAEWPEPLRRRLLRLAGTRA